MTDLRSETARLAAVFEGAGAIQVEPPVLLPAHTLLDLYGEDIRGRAYVTSDALRGEQMLRPDFTVPVVQMHMSEGAEPARYTYAGKVFRRQEHDPDRAHEYIQVGYEVFDRGDAGATDAEVFSMVAQALDGLSLRPATGDMGILMAAVTGLQTNAARKAALMRHIWRPRRFRALLDRYAGRTPPSPAHTALLDGNVGAEAPLNGRRTRHEISARIAALRAEADTEPLSQTEVDGVAALLAVRETMPFALSQLQDISVDLPSIAQAVDHFKRRLDALQSRGVDIESLGFEANFGRTSMEYYDGFVFGFYANARPDLPPVATGGRYDALTRRLGQGNTIPAVGAVIRPDLIVQMNEVPA